MREREIERERRGREGGREGGEGGRERREIAEKHETQFELNQSKASSTFTTHSRV